MLKPSKSTLKLGKVIAGQSGKAIGITLTNASKISASINSLPQHLSGTVTNFAVSGDNCSGQKVAPGKKCTFDVAFTPHTFSSPSSNELTATLPVVYNSAGGIPLEITLSGMPEPVTLSAPKSESFSGIAGSTSKPKTVRITNNTKVPVTLGTGSALPATDYSLVSDSCSAAILGPAPAQKSCTVGVVFKPSETTKGAVPAAILGYTFTWNGAAFQNNVAISLKGAVK